MDLLAGLLMALALVAFVLLMGAAFVAVAFYRDV